MSWEYGRVADNHHWLYSHWLCCNNVRHFNVPWELRAIYDYVMSRQVLGWWSLSNLYHRQISQIQDNNWSKTAFRIDLVTSAVPSGMFKTAGIQTFTQNILPSVITADEVLKLALTYLPFLPLLSIRLAFPSLILLTLTHWLQGICSVVLNHVSTPLECILGRWAAIMLNTCSCVPLQKQMTTIILISALFGPLQQSGRLSSEGTWVSLVHHRVYLKHIVPIVWCSPVWFAQWQQRKHLAFKSCLTLSIIRVQSWNHLHREVNQNKGTLAMNHLVKWWYARFGGQYFYFLYSVGRWGKEESKATLEENTCILWGLNKWKSFVWFWCHEVSLL